MSKIKTKIKPLLNNNYLLKYIYLISVVLGTITLLSVMLFLYHNVYETLAQAELVNNLKTEVVNENINLNKFNEIIEKLKKKSSCTELKISELRDPTVFVENQ